MQDILTSKNPQISADKLQFIKAVTHFGAHSLVVPPRTKGETLY